MPSQHVLINGSSGTIKVAPATVNGSKKNKDNIVWMGTSHFEIIFDPISPFGGDHFVSSPCKPKWGRVNKKDGATRSGYIECADSDAIETDAALGDYKYIVRIPGLPDLDPNVHVDP